MVPVADIFRVLFLSQVKLELSPVKISYCCCKASPAPDKLVEIVTFVINKYLVNRVFPATLLLLMIVLHLKRDRDRANAFTNILYFTSGMVDFKKSVMGRKSWSLVFNSIFN